MSSLLIPLLAISIAPLAMILRARRRWAEIDRAAHRRAADPCRPAERLRRLEGRVAAIEAVVSGDLTLRRAIEALETSRSA